REAYPGSPFSRLLAPSPSRHADPSPRFHRALIRGFLTPANRRPTRAAFWSRYSISARIHKRMSQPHRIRKAQFVATGHLHQPEQTQFLRWRGMQRILMRHQSVFSAIDVRFRYGHLRRVDSERDLVSQGAKRVRIQHTVRPLRHVKVGVVDERLPPDREWQDDGPVAAFGRYRVEQ